MLNATLSTSNLAAFQGYQTRPATTRRQLVLADLKAALADPTKRAALKQAIDGLTADQRSKAQNAKLETLFKSIANGTAKPPKVLLAATANPDDIAASKAGTALPEGVLGAYVSSQNAILLNKTLKGQDAAVVLKEEYGEWLTGLAKAAGVKTAPGDAGNRIVRTLNGETLSPDTSPDAFRQRADDKATVSIDGKAREARSSHGVLLNLYEGLKGKSNGRYNIPGTSIKIRYTGRTRTILEQEREKYMDVTIASPNRDFSSNAPVGQGGSTENVEYEGDFWVQFPGEDFYRHVEVTSKTTSLSVTVSEGADLLLERSDRHDWDL